MCYLNVIAALLAAVNVLCTGCTKQPDDRNAKPIEGPGNVVDSVSDRYIVFFLTNTSVDQADAINTGKDANTAYTFVGELPQLFGELNANSPYKYAFGLTGPLLLTQSITEMQYQINKAFDIAEKYQVPVYFQLDDINNYTTDFGGGATPKFYEQPDWCEWVSFPQANENWGGESNGRLPYFWFNWGNWMHADAFPNLASEGFRAFVKSQLEDGVLPALTARYQALKSQGKEYLFAGMAIGWETHIPDYSPNNTIYQIDPGNLPVNVLLGDQMQPWEATTFGYAALHHSGKTTYDREALYAVIQDYSSFLAKTAYDAGIPRHKIFTHIVGIKSDQPMLNTTFAPPIWTAVNDYSIPGFTMSPFSCPYHIPTLKSEIHKVAPEQPYFGNVEGYSAGVDGSFEQADAYFGELFGNGALMVAVFGWGREAPNSAYVVSHSPESPFVKAAQKWLSNRVAEWEFVDDAEGWTAGNDMESLGWQNNGAIEGKLTGNDAFLLSPSALGYELNDHQVIRISMRNDSPNTVGQIYFTTDSSPDWSEGKRKDFVIQPNSGYQVYTIDMSDIPEWTGVLNQFRVDPSNTLPGNPTGGSFAIDFIHVGSVGWDFDQDLSGWTVGQHVDALKWTKIPGTYIGGVLTGPDAFLFSPDNIGVPLPRSKQVVIRIRNNSVQTIGQLYFTTESDTAWNTEKQQSFTIAPYSDYTTYTIDMSVVPSWTGQLKQLRLDVANALPNTTVGGTFQLDYVYIVE